LSILPAVARTLTNKAGINRFNDENNRRVKIRQGKYLNNIIEQGHRRVKRITRSKLGFKSFHAAQSTLAGIELMAMTSKDQMKKSMVGSLSPAKQSYALAAQVENRFDVFHANRSNCDIILFHCCELFKNLVLLTSQECIRF